MTPRGLSREEAADYCGLTISKFDAQVRAGTLPAALPFGKPHVWDRQALDLALDRLSGLATADNGEAAALQALHARQDAIRHRKTQPRRP